MSTETTRLAVLVRSLEKKERLFDQKLSHHMDDVKSANGQPLNDKRNGTATTGRWERQNAGLRTLRNGIEKTKAAIEREEDKISHVASMELPDFLRTMLESGELKQWRKHPTTFFVSGVERGRIVWNAEYRTISHRYLSEVPKEQFPLFKDAFNRANAGVRAEKSASAA